jgi:hypothetical protein
MNMIWRAADDFGNPIRRANQSAEVFMQTPAPCAVNQWPPFFRAEHDVVMEA